MRGWHIWKKRISAALACVVMFVTVYLMVLPAITLDLDTAEDDESIVMEEAVDPEETEGASEAWEVPEGEEDPSGQAMEEELYGAETDSGGESRREKEEREELKKQADPGKGSRTLTGEEEGYVFTVSFGEDAMLPSDVSLRTREIPAGTQEYDKYMERALDAVRKEEGEEALISYARFFDIAFVKDGKEVEPAGPVSLVIGCRKSAKDRAEEAESSALNTAGPVSMKETDAVNVVHFDDRESSEPALMDIETRVKDELVESISFEADSFSVYGVVGTVIEKKILTGDGKSYKVTVTYGPETGIPEGAQLDAREITEGSAVNGRSYEEYAAYSENALGLEESSSRSIRMFEISILKDGKKVQPAAGTGMDVRIELEGTRSKNLNVVHFADGSVQGEEVKSSTESGERGAAVEFLAESFSVYSVVEAPAPVHYEPYKLSSVGEIEENTVYHLSYAAPEIYFTSRLNNSGCLIETSDSSSAADWYFEKADEDGSTFYIYTITGGAKKYIRQKKAGENPIELAASGTAFVLTEAEDAPGRFIIKHSLEERYLQHSGGGKGIRFYTDAANITNARIYITNMAADGGSDDPYGLDGQSFGIAYHDDSASAAALSAEEKNADAESRLAGVDMLIRPDVLGGSGTLLVAENSDIQEWTFESAGEDRYYIRADVNGTDRYLKISGKNVTLTDDRADASQIRALPGTGQVSGKWKFTAGDYSLNFAGSAAGFNADNEGNSSVWLNLVERSTLNEDDFVYYTARKISASDDLLSAVERDADGEILKDGSGNPVFREDKARVIVYTRVWNSETSKYEFYAVDHDGSLVRVYDSGDQISWVGNQVNSALWEFTEYTYDDGSPSAYYELENTAYANTFLAPQSSGIISDHTVGINMEGRQEGFDYTTILAWDEKAYAYSGLKVEGGRVVSCPKDEADDFYFAVLVPPVLEADPPTTVETVDNNEYGISIRMIDFNNTVTSDNRDSVQHAFFGGHAYNQTKPDQGLLSTDLTGGYPSTTDKTGHAGRSLSELFSGMTPANHLFIQSVHNESGYFEYDSTQNFAHLNEDGRFTVYNQLGAIGTSTGDTRTHGQFMPYNDISAGKGYAHDTKGNLITNKTDVLRRELPDSNPRKGEPLYSIPDADADYFFGMELSASFTQTPSGLDNWGHDIIFEFTGDDDFWLYVDGELVLDLGGIHSAMPGSVNFRTGEVVINKTRTTLYDIFKGNYQKRGLSEAEAERKLNEIFEEKEVDGRKVHIFSDYSTHTMKMFYMERGTGASNLKMRFNLASVQPGTVELSKKLAGTQGTSNKLIQYPYQIWYRMPVYRTENDTIVHDENGDPVIESYGAPILMAQGASASADTGAVYKGSRKLVSFRESLNIGGTEYENVFLLKSGETAVVRFPDHNCMYEIIECGVDTQVYEQVTVNGEEISGSFYHNTDTGTAGGPAGRRMDFGIPYETTESRPRAEYSNKTAPGVMRTLSFTKVLYDADGNPMSEEETENVSARFSFRLYLGNEFADGKNLSPASMYSYCVKDPDGSYCRWNSDWQRFDSLGINDFEGTGGLEEYLSGADSAERSAVIFTTSLNGAITGIPAGYTVEVRDLIVGTRYRVEEPDREIPKGYTRRDSDGYVRTDLPDGVAVYYTEGGIYGRHPETGNTVTAEPISDTIADRTESPRLEIRNQEGWGLTAEKEWTDRDFMIHDPIYLAVYLNDGKEDPGTLIDGTVRRLDTGKTEVYWFFPDLKVNDEPYSFDRFIIREVELTGNPSVDESTGAVTGFTGISPIADGGSTSVGGRTVSGVGRTENYTVSYRTGESTGQNANIRTDTVTNSRPGIQIYKTDWSGDSYLTGAVFTLKDSGGSDVGAAAYTSDSKGLVTTAYLNEGTFTLEEIRTPSGYAAPDGPISLTVTAEEPDSYDLAVTAGSAVYYITLSGPSDFYTATPASESSMARITVKNRTLQELKVVKEGVDGEDRRSLSGVHFALYEQVRDSEGNLRPSYNPRTGYEDLVTDQNGILGEIGMSLGAGTYYLREKAAPSGYKKLAEDLCFTIGEDGTVMIRNAGYSGWLTRDTSLPGLVSYRIGIENTPLGISIRKTDEKGNALPGSKFVLCRKTEAGGFESVTEYGLGEDGLIDLTDKAEMTFTGMKSGIYMLTETDAPSGYVILTGDIYFSVSNGAVTLTDKEGNPETYPDVSLLDDNTTIAVKNTPGVPLPSAGGPGTGLYTIPGAFLAAGAVWLLRRRRKNI